MENNFIITDIKINDKYYEIPLINKLNEFLKQFENMEYKEIVIDGNNKTSMIILMNKQKSMCVFFKDIEHGISYHSLNGNGKQNIYEKFILSNGQLDEYEDIYLIENEKIGSVIEYYFENGIISENIVWKED
jgi:redox-regulated HSP33 family molecular chaperone